MSPGTLVLVGAAGAVGTVLRYAVDRGVTRRLPPGFPSGTFVVNASASVLLGLLVGLAASSTTTLVAGTGLLGGYSTFSTWMADSHRLAGDGHRRAAAMNVVLSVVVGVLGVVAGRAVAGTL